MTVSIERVTQGIVGDGANLVFTYVIPFLVETNLTFTWLDTSSGIATLLTEGDDYTLDANLVDDVEITILLGGSSVFASAPVSTDTIYVRRKGTIDQVTYDREATDPFPPIPTEDRFDETVLRLQETEEATDRSLQTNDVDGGKGIVVTVGVENTVLTWDDEGNVKAGPSSSGIPGPQGEDGPIGPPGPAWVTQTEQTITDGGTFTLDGDNRVIPVKGTAGADTQANQIFGPGPFTEGQVVRLLGTDSDNFVRLVNKDFVNGTSVNGIADLLEGRIIELQSLTVSGTQKWREISKNF